MHRNEGHYSRCKTPESRIRKTKLTEKVSEAKIGMCMHMCSNMHYVTGLVNGCYDSSPVSTTTCSSSIVTYIEQLLSFLDMANTVALPHVRLRRKIKFESSPTEWFHQRGGWSYVLQQLRSQLYAPDGILCISALEEIIFKEEVITEPWIGFVHQVPKSNYPWYPDVERVVKHDVFIKSLKHCQGLFVISNRVKSYLVKHISVPVAHVSYPVTPFPKELRFSWEKYEAESTKTVLFIGEFMRNFQAFYDLEVPPGYKKMLLKPPDVRFNNLYNDKKEKVVLETNKSVTLVERVANEAYDQLLSCCVVFLNLYDAAANTVVLECLGRSTPVVVNRLPGVEEYLGVNYPLFYNTLSEASAMLGNSEKLTEATHYLAKHFETNPLTSERFIKEFTSSAIYRALPLPKSQIADPRQTKFPNFDLTVVICSYKRVYNMKRLLECFHNQDYSGRFELILWNNNKDTQTEITEICAPFMSDLNIRLIQSTENYYCIVRLAVSHLMQSDVLLICDDDVIPNPNYISKFMAKYEQYGSRSVIGCRGHVFRHHSLYVEHPHLFWEDYCNMKFFDEAKPDQQVCWK